MKNPCWNCQERKPLCHSSCPRYSAYYEENRRADKARHLKNEAYYQNSKDRKRALRARRKEKERNKQ